jgi:hypothetical protein
MTSKARTNRFRSIIKGIAPKLQIGLLIFGESEGIHMGQDLSFMIFKKRPGDRGHNLSAPATRIVPLPREQLPAERMTDWRAPQ